MGEDVNSTTGNLEQYIVEVLSEQEFDYEPEIVINLCDFVKNQAIHSLETARYLAEDKNAQIQPSDILVAFYGVNSCHETEKPSVVELEQFAENINEHKLQKHFSQIGLRLPPGGCTLGQCNYKLKTCFQANPNI